MSAQFERTRSLANGEDLRASSTQPGCFDATVIEIDQIATATAIEVPDPGRCKTMVSQNRAVIFPCRFWALRGVGPIRS